MLHLHEIGRLESLAIFDQLMLPNLVVDELHSYGIDLVELVGSIGILVRAYTLSRIGWNELEASVDAIFTTSTLHLSRAFRTFVRQLLDGLP